MMDNNAFQGIFSNKKVNDGQYSRNERKKFRNYEKMSDKQTHLSPPGKGLPLPLGEGGEPHPASGKPPVGVSALSYESRGRHNNLTLLP